MSKRADALRKDVTLSSAAVRTRCHVWFEWPFNGLVDLLGPSIQACHSRPIIAATKIESELGGDHHFVMERRKRLAHDRARQLAILPKENERITISHFQSTNIVENVFRPALKSEIEAGSANIRESNH